MRLRHPLVLAAGLALGHAAPADADCSFRWSCGGNSGCMSVMQRPNGVASGAPDMAACNAAREKWRSMGVPPTSPCTCTGGADATTGAFGANSPLGIMQQAFASAHQQAQSAAAANRNFSAGLAEQQAQQLSAEERAAWDRHQAEQERQRRKREELLRALARIGDTDLGAPGVNDAVDLRAGTNFFGGPSNPTRADPIVVPGPAIVVPQPLPTPEGRPVDPTEIERAEQAWRNAREDKERAEEQQRKLEAEKKEAERKREEAEKKYQEQQAKVQTVPPEQADKRKEEDDKLAEAERLLKEATELDQKASDELDKAEKSVQQATQQVERAGKARAELAAPPPQAPQSAR